METKTVELHSGSGTLDLRVLRAVLDLWWRNYTTRRELLTLDDHELSDIGIDRATAVLEGRKPFWRS